MRMNHIVICGLNNFPHYLTNGTIFEKSFSNINAFWFSLHRLSETFLILRRNEWCMISHVVCWSLCDVFVVVLRWLWILNFHDGFSKKKYLSDEFNENLSSGNRGVPCGRADGWTDRQTQMTTKPTVAFLHFANAPYKLVEQREYNVWANTISSNWFIDNVQGDL
jgi:hypothetical protein